MARRSALAAFASAGVVTARETLLEPDGLARTLAEVVELGDDTLPERFTAMSAIRGEWTGNLRSTPSPWTIRRTTNISRVLVPERAMTTPLKI